MAADLFERDEEPTGPDGRGYVRLWRKVVDSQVFRDAELLRLFVWLLARATHRRRKVAGVELQPGQVLFGRHAAAADLGTPASTTYDRLRRLAGLQIVGIEPGNSFSVVTLLHWSLYQADDETDPAANPATNRQQTGTYKNSKNSKHVNNSCAQSPPEGFSDWWKAYPRKVAERAAAKAYAAAVKRIAAERSIDTAKAQSDLLAVTTTYAASVNGSDPKFIPYPASWLNAGRYDDDPQIWKTNHAQRNGTANGHASAARPRSGEYSDPASYGNPPVAAGT